MKTLYIFLVSLSFTSISYSATPDHAHVSYGPESQQWLDIYIAPSDNPTPVYFDAHGNGGTTNMPNSIVNDLKAEGISIIAWESLTSVNSETEVETGWADAELMFAWVKDNADTYNLDTTNFIIGGSSRGSILSWKYAHRDDPNIKGLYMYNALPDGIWVDSTWWYPPNEVTVASPSIFFVYQYEPGTTNSHDPENGIIIMDKYDELEIGDLDTMVHSIEYSGNDNKYQFLVDFALSVLDAPLPVELLNFSGATVQDNILLTWQTASEINSATIEVEESQDGILFQKIGGVNGQGTSTEQQDYSFEVGPRQSGLYYYRLKQIDFDGTFKYSVVISINIELANKPLSLFYPNPSTTKMVYLDFHTENDAELPISVFDQAGKLMTHQLKQVRSGDNNLSFDFSILNTGIYFIKIGIDKNPVYQKLIIK